ncbi:MAG: FG-GAP repeat protein [Halobacteriales archaeon]
MSTRRRMLHALGAAVVAGLAGCNTGHSPTATRTLRPWPRRPDPVTKLTADDGDARDGFAFSADVSADGTTAVIGAFGDDPGSAYVFERTTDGWTEQAKLVADDGHHDDRFGWQLALSDDADTAIVGAYLPDESTGENAGSAYVFEQDGDSWVQQAKLVASDGDAGDEFGSSVGLSGDATTAVVGADETDGFNGENSGAAYVFQRGDGNWTQPTKLTADDAGDNFGSAAAVSKAGDIIIVGAPSDDDPNGEGGGSAYVFERAGADWDQRAKLAADDGDPKDRFGTKTRLSAEGATAIVSAWRDDDPNGEKAGSAYVFERTDGDWTQTTKLTPQDGDDDDSFGDGAE